MSAEPPTHKRRLEEPGTADVSFLLQQFERPLPALPAPDENPPVVSVVLRQLCEGPFIATHPIDALFIRNSCYPPLWDRVHHALQLNQSIDVLLVGNPGIGKSIGALNYLAMKCLKEAPGTVILVLHMTCPVVFLPERQEGGGIVARRYSLGRSLSKALLADRGPMFAELFHAFVTKNRGSPNARADQVATPA